MSSSPAYEVDVELERLHWTVDLSGVVHVLDLIPAVMLRTVAIEVDGRTIGHVEKAAPQRPWRETAVEIDGAPVVVATIWQRRDVRFDYRRRRLTIRASGESKELSRELLRRWSACHEAASDTRRARGERVLSRAAICQRAAGSSSAAVYLRRRCRHRTCRWDRAVLFLVSAFVPGDWPAPKLARDSRGRDLPSWGP